MKTLSLIGIILIVGGLLLAIYGYSLYANVACNCPVQITGQPSNCHCGEEEEGIGHLTIYTGIAIIFGGIGFFVHSWRKSAPGGLWK
ncbi:MAG: hypothetical protein KGL95_08940 [Patescibacteria group bacterium]|nr:hypothetical protein [Patescibacteria group bacterium]